MKEILKRRTKERFCRTAAIINFSSSKHFIHWLRFFQSSSWPSLRPEPAAGWRSATWQSRVRATPSSRSRELSSHDADSLSLSKIFYLFLVPFLSDDHDLLIHFIIHDIFLLIDIFYQLFSPNGRKTYSPKLKIKKTQKLCDGGVNLHQIPLTNFGQ